MNNVLFSDRPTSHRVLLGNVRRVVHARYDWEGNFIRFVVHRTPVEMEAARRSYLPAKVGIASWFEVYEHNFQMHPDDEPQDYNPPFLPRKSQDFS